LANESTGERSNIAAPLKALVVDDQVLNRMLLRMIIEDSGFVVVEAESGEAAARKAARTAFAFIVMDQNMPGLSGDETVRRIRAKGASAKAFVARWTTGRPDPKDAPLYDAELPKPIIDAVLTAAAAAARRRAAEAPSARRRSRSKELATSAR